MAWPVLHTQPKKAGQVDFRVVEWEAVSGECTTVVDLTSAVEVGWSRRCKSYVADIK